MYKTLQKSGSDPPYLDKLAQYGTHPSRGTLKADFEPEPFRNFQTDKTAKKTPLPPGRKRANAKFFARHLQNLLFYGCPDSPLHKSYLNTYFCTHAVEFRAGKEITTYCKNRWCLPCARIRTAQYINDYEPQILTMPAPHMITLTRRNVPGENLKDEISELIRLRILLMDAEKKTRQRNKSEKLQALFKIEVTFNERRNDYHPHYHAILPDKGTAQRTLDRWLSSESNRGKVSAAGQDIRPVLDKFATKELFKYFTKLISKDPKTKEYKIYPANVLDLIFNAMRRRQVYTTYGLRKSDEVYEGQTLNDLDLDQDFDYFFMWQQDIADWVEQNTGELLTGNKPSPAIIKIFEK